MPKLFIVCRLYFGRVAEPTIKSLFRAAFLTSYRLAWVVLWPCYITLIRLLLLKLGKWGGIGGDKGATATRLRAKLEHFRLAPLLKNKKPGALQGPTVSGKGGASVRGPKSQLCKVFASNIVLPIVRAQAPFRIAIWQWPAPSTLRVVASCLFVAVVPRPVPRTKTQLSPRLVLPKLNLVLWARLPSTRAKSKLV